MLRSGGAVTDKLFTGQQRETTNGLYHYGARLYNADIGRFISADSIGVAPGNPQTLNRYSYVLNNPVNHADPTTATGIRISEAVGLRLGDVCLGERAGIRVFGKGGKERALPLHETAARALQDYIERWRPRLAPQSDHVFINRYGLPVGRRIVQQEIKRYAASVGITERVYPHLLRHSFATAMMRAGVPLPVLQELLGHSSISTTAIYAHVSPEHLRTAYMAYHPGAS
jgi:RHS repeat-associated protein